MQEILNVAHIEDFESHTRSPRSYCRPHIRARLPGRESFVGLGFGFCLGAGFRVGLLEMA